MKYSSVVRLGVRSGIMVNLKRPELKLVGNVSENFKNVELRFNDYCIQANYRNLAKDPVTERVDHYKSPLLEISALRSSLPDKALLADLVIPTDFVVVAIAYFFTVLL